MDADLSGSTFTDVSLSGATFNDVNLAGATINDSKTDGMTIDGIAVADLIATYRAANAKAN